MSNWPASTWRAGTTRRRAREYDALDQARPDGAPSRSSRRSSRCGRRASRARPARLYSAVTWWPCRSSSVSLVGQLPQRRHRPRPRGPERVGASIGLPRDAGRSSPGTTISRSCRSSCCEGAAAAAARAFPGAIRSWRRRRAAPSRSRTCSSARHLEFLVAAVLLAALIAITAIDLRHQIIPDVISAAGHRGGRSSRTASSPAASAGSIP